MPTEPWLLGLEIWVAMRHPMCVLGIKLWSFGRAVVLSTPELSFQLQLVPIFMLLFKGLVCA